MENLITLFSEIMAKTVTAVIESLIHNWIPLSLAIIIAAVLKVYINSEKLKQRLLGKSKVSIPASVAFGTFTPFCACGTMAVVIGMLTTTLSWGAVMAFLTSSPLMSPTAFVMLSGIISLKFAVALLVASIVIGLGSGYLTYLIERKTDFLKNQTRFSEKTKVQTGSCSDKAPAGKPMTHTCGCADNVVIRNESYRGTQVCCAVASGKNLTQSACPVVFYKSVTNKTGINILSGFLKRIKWREISEALIKVGIKQILLFYSIFVAVGFIINYFIPASLIVSLFSTNNILAVPLAALIGLPIYISGESSIPLIQVLMTGGASGGAMLAFMITGQGTSAWVIAGMATFMRRKVLTLYILFIVGWGIILGYIYDLLLVMGV